MLSKHLAHSIFIPQVLQKTTVTTVRMCFIISILLISIDFTLWWGCSVTFLCALVYSDQTQCPLSTLLLSQFLEIITLLFLIVYSIYERVWHLPSYVWLIPLNYNVFQFLCCIWKDFIILYGWKIPTLSMWWAARKTPYLRYSEQFLSKHYHAGIFLIC